MSELGLGLQCMYFNARGLKGMMVNTGCRYSRYVRLGYCSRHWNLSILTFQGAGVTDDIEVGVKEKGELFFD